jgi:shikimate kinase
MKQRVYLFIGPPSSGKSYLGKNFAESRGYNFYEADDDYLQEYRKRTVISSEEKEKVYEEFYNIVIKKIKGILKESDQPLVVASAIGKKRNRTRFREEFGMLLTIVYIKSRLKDLLNNAIKYEFPSLRGEKVLDPAEKIKLTKHLKKKYRDYEKPKEVVTIENDYTEDTIKKLFKELD